MRLSVCCLLTLLLTGCQYENSFLNLNSDSGVPFLGLQMSVDAKDVHQADPQDSIQLVSSHQDDVVTRKPETRAQSPEWPVIPAATVPTTMSPNPLSGDNAEEHPLTAVGRSLAAF